MADERDERRRRRRRSSSSSSRRRRMDLNLYIGLPLSPRRPSLDLGSDLALSSLPLSNSSADMSSDSHVPYSPSPPNPPTRHQYIRPDREEEEEEEEDEEEDTYFPSPPMIPVPGFAPISSPDSDVPIEIEDDDDDPNSPPRGTGPTDDPRSPYYFPPTYDPRSPYYFPPRSWSYIPLDNEDFPPSPPYSPTSPSYARPATPRPEWPARNDESSSRWDQLDSPEHRFRRLIESNRRLRVRRFRSPLPYPHSGQLRFGRPPSPEPEQLMLDIMNSQRSLASNGKHKVQAARIASESSDEGKEEKKKSAANFECNICLDMAEDPVVTSCGHLFCWPCLYQWLHVHSEHKECPVCKGEVTECNITPIYGRGSSGARDGKKLAENRESGVKIPPRPSGNRLDSLRQQLQPLPRRYAEGTVTSWRHPNYMQIRSRYRYDARGDPSLQGLSSQQIALLNRVRAGHPREGVIPESELEPEPEDFHMSRESSAVPQRSNAGSLRGGQAALGRRMRARLMGEESHAESRPEVEEIRMSRGSAAAVPHFREGISPRRRVSVYGFTTTTTDGVHADSADAGRIIGSSNRYGASTSLDTLGNERRSSWANIPSAADQASASSTAAMIRGDVSQPDDPVERNSRGFA